MNMYSSNRSYSYFLYMEGNTRYYILRKSVNTERNRMINGTISILCKHENTTSLSDD